MEKPNRKLPRMNGFDYSQEAVYFVTICSHEKKHIFGEVSRIGDTNVFSPSRIGELVKEIFFRLPERFPEFSLIHFSLLPNHLHFLTMKMKTDPETERSLSDLVGAFKSLSYRAVRNEIGSTIFMIQRKPSQPFLTPAVAPARNCSFRCCMMGCSCQPRRFRTRRPLRRPAAPMSGRTAPSGAALRWDPYQTTGLRVKHYLSACASFMLCSKQTDVVVHARFPQNMQGEP